MQHGDAAPEGLVVGPGGSPVSSVSCDGHDNRVVFEDLTKLAKLDFFIETGEMPGQRVPDWLRARAGLARQTRKIRPPRARVVTMTRPVAAT